MGCNNFCNEGLLWDPLQSCHYGDCYGTSLWSPLEVWIIGLLWIPIMEIVMEAN